MITPNTTIAELCAQPELHKAVSVWWPYGADMLSVLSERRIAELCGEGTPFHAQDVADGLNFLSSAAQGDSGFLKPLYSKEETAADPTKEAVSLLCFPATDSKRTALLCSGGGYNTVANLVEALPVARFLWGKGISSYVLQYRTGLPYTVPKADEDLRRALCLMLQLESDKPYGVIGFSAGGHLAAGLLTKDRGAGQSGLPAPEIIGLAYPLLSTRIPETLQAGSELHDCYRTMFGSHLRDGTPGRYDILKNFSDEAPAVYLWQTKDDETVPYSENTGAFVTLLSRRHHPFREKPVASGGHGRGLGTDSQAEGWAEEWIEYWNDINRREKP